ncbi:hypothetical protein BDV24DRAFT_156303 [Aspergillus arachidicola]|uniref:Uncharacterized protein n=1 Tax=Aspergillus arachidicola TaxID=656916 RepID=A0A5N6XPF7_9EURO|nr:hypothetical protein BDV24DRAFT_156303 [Aspergillus arachidicola]
MIDLDGQMSGCCATLSEQDELGQSANETSYRPPYYTCYSGLRMYDRSHCHEILWPHPLSARNNILAAGIEFSWQTPSTPIVVVCRTVCSD